MIISSVNLQIAILIIYTIQVFAKPRSMLFLELEEFNSIPSLNLQMKKR